VPRGLPEADVLRGVTGPDEASEPPSRRPESAGPEPGEPGETLEPGVSEPPPNELLTLESLPGPLDGPLGVAPVPGRV
jgi:hypothetical protein